MRFDRELGGGVRGVDGVDIVGVVIEDKTSYSSCLRMGSDWDVTNVRAMSSSCLQDVFTRICIAVNRKRQ